MTRDEAARILGVAADASPAEARTAFRALIRQRHPDRSRGVASAHADATVLIAAHRTFSRPAGTRAAATGAEAAPPPAPGPAFRPVATVPLDARADGDALFVDADPWMVMARLVEVGHELGDVTYLDRSSGLVEVLLQVQEEGDDRPAACSLVATLQGRHHGVEVFCTVERLDGHPAPPIAPIVAALGAAMGA